MPKMHQNAFGGRDPPGPASWGGGASALPQNPLSAIEGSYFYDGTRVSAVSIARAVNTATIAAT